MIRYSSSAVRKEIAIAILVGCLIGLAVAFGIWRAKQAFRPVSQKNEQPLPQTSKATQTNKNSSGNLLVTSPERDSVVSEEQVLVQGSASPNAIIVILAASGEIISQAKEDGSFSEEVKLVGGPNEIKITAYDKEGNKTQTTLTIVYSTEFPKP